MASNTAPLIESSLPVMSADAIEPESPLTAARMRASMASRIDSTPIANCSRQLGSTGGASILIAPSARPVEPAH